MEGRAMRTTDEPTRDLPRLGFMGRLLMALSGVYEDRESPDGPRSSEGALDLIDHVLPDFGTQIGGKRVLDFGCGTGKQAVAMAHLGAEVVGVDIQEAYLEMGRQLARKESIGHRVTFTAAVPPSETFDWVVSQNSMEHFSDPSGTLKTMARHLRERSRLLVTFCPTWLSPYGAHMNFFTRVPWVHLLFPESTVMAVRARYRSDGAMRYGDVTGGLNKMTVRRFDRIVEECGLEPELRANEYVKDLRWVARLPGLEEFFTNRVTQVLRRRDNDD